MCGRDLGRDGWLVVRVLGMIEDVLSPRRPWGRAPGTLTRAGRVVSKMR